MDDLQLGTRQQLSIVAPEDKELQSVWVMDGGAPTNLTYQPVLPARDSSLEGAVKCAHCLLLPRGLRDAHNILAIANPDFKPQRAWFFTDALPYVQAHGPKVGYGNWEINEQRAKLTLVTGETVIWKLTDLYAGPALRLGVWAD